MKGFSGLFISLKELSSRLLGLLISLRELQSSLSGLFFS